MGSETSLAQLARLVKEAQTGKAPVQRLADRVSAVFVPVVIVLAASTLGFWLARTSQWPNAFAPAVSVLIAGVIAADGTSVDDVLRMAAAVEAGSEHPIAAAILRHAADRLGPVADANALSIQPGVGATGIVDGTSDTVKPTSAAGLQALRDFGLHPVLWIDDNRRFDPSR